MLVAQHSLRKPYSFTSGQFKPNMVNTRRRINFTMESVKAERRSESSPLAAMFKLPLSPTQSGRLPTAAPRQATRDKGRVVVTTLPSDVAGQSMVNSCVWGFRWSRRSAPAVCLPENRKMFRPSVMLVSYMKLLYQYADHEPPRSGGSMAGGSL